VASAGRSSESSSACSEGRKEANAVPYLRIGAGVLANISGLRNSRGNPIYKTFAGFAFFRAAFTSASLQL